MAPRATLFLTLLLVFGCQRQAGSTAKARFSNSLGMAFVSLSTGWSVSVYETRQSDFVAIMGYNPSRYIGLDLPVHSLTAAMAEEFCCRLTEYDRAGKAIAPDSCYALPLPDEWITCAKSSPLESAIVTGKRAIPFTMPLPVGSGDVNHLGLWDLRGNVDEYTREVSPHGRVVVGASWNERLDSRLRVEHKGFTQSPDHRSSTLGFRCFLFPPSSGIVCKTDDSALHKAAATGDVKQAIAALEANTSIDPSNRWGETPLHRAAIWGHADMVKLLLNRGAKPDVARESQLTPLHMACLAGRCEVVGALIAGGADIEAENVASERPLHLSIRHPTVVAALIRSGANIHAIDDFEWTPLHHAASAGQLESVRLLLQAGAKVNVVGNLWTPLDCAIKSGDIPTIELLKASGGKRRGDL